MLCQADKAGILSANGIVSEMAINQARSVMKGTYRGMLFRRGTESAKGSAPRTALSNQVISSMSPASKMASAMVITSARCLMDCKMLIATIFSWS